jgi:hypothetical protein
MAMLDHLIVPSRDRKASAKFLADLLGVRSGKHSASSRLFT